MTKSKNILIAPLNWGLGHATRCIPIINALLSHGFTPLIASDGEALILLQKEFPNLKTFDLPSYNVKYAKNGKYFRWKMLLSVPKLVIAIQKEQQQINSIAAQHDLCGIISDNRFGVYLSSIPSVYISHQLNILSGWSTKLTSWLHQKSISKFNECWVPDISEQTSFSGKLGENTTILSNIKHIGVLSRFKKKETMQTYEYLILLSGPEPQRTLLETKLLHEFQNYSKPVLCIQGKVATKQYIKTLNNITVYNFMTSEQLEDAIHESTVVISRSGYTTIMDLATINKKAFFIPTPGQYEQEYLARRMQKLQYAPYATQNDFNLNHLSEVDNFNGLCNTKHQIDYKTLFTVFD